MHHKRNRMFKKIHNKFLRALLIGITGILGLLVLFFLAIYLLCPSYSFEQPEPFSGEYLYNPYQNMNPDNWKKYNFHSHSHKFLGITNGRLSKESDIDSIYSWLGYDHYGISDYMHINDHHSDEDTYIPAYEHGYGVFHKTHQLCIGAEKVWKIDYPFMQNIDMKQNTINKLGERCRFAVPAHASYTKGYRINDMKYLSNYRLLEVLNPFGWSIEYWDMALSHGHRVYIIGDDDSHNVLNPNEVGRNFTMINTDDMKAEHVYEALEQGNAYGVDFLIYHDSTFECKAGKMKLLPHLTRCELSGDTLFVQTSADNIELAEFIGQDGKVLKTQQNVDTAFYVIQPGDTYVRTKLQLPRLTFFFLNPITRHPSATPEDHRLDSINYFRSCLLWAVYVFMIFAIVRIIVKKPEKEKEQDNEQDKDNGNEMQ